MREEEISRLTNQKKSFVSLTVIAAVTVVVVVLVVVSTASSRESLMQERVSREQLVVSDQHPVTRIEILFSAFGCVCARREN